MYCYCKCFVGFGVQVVVIEFGIKKILKEVKESRKRNKEENLGTFLES